MSAKGDRKLKCWINPQDGYIEIGEPPKGIKPLYMTEEEIRRHNRNRNIEIEMALRSGELE